jgi:sn-glycerol 3-phosphate transport system ATP-binding protein
VLGVRPEHLSLSDTGWPVRLQAVEMLGAERLLHGRLGDEPLVLRIRGDAPFPPVGSSVWVQPNPHQLHSFDTQTGRRI